MSLPNPPPGELTPPPEGHVRTKPDRGGTQRKATPLRAVTLDAFGTLLALDDPLGSLRRSFASMGYEIPKTPLATAFRAEVGYYKDHHVEGSTPEGLAKLRRRCYGVFRAALREEGGPTLPEDARGEHALVAGLRFRLFEDALPTLHALRARGLRVAVLSNWDCALPAVLAALGLAASSSRGPDRAASEPDEGGRTNPGGGPPPGSARTTDKKATSATGGTGGAGDGRRAFALEAVFASAAVGFAKPDPRLFAHACGHLGLPAHAVLHVGDQPELDRDPPRLIGMRSLWLDREGSRPAHPEDRDRITTLADLPAWLAAEERPTSAG